MIGPGRGRTPGRFTPRTGNSLGGHSMSKWLLVVPVAGALGSGSGSGADKLREPAAHAEARQDVKPAVTLPITRVVLFNSGVGYFSRSGEVTDDARVDLTFPEEDINDLLKSMVLEDF